MLAEHPLKAGKYGKKFFSLLWQISRAMYVCQGLKEMASKVLQKKCEGIVETLKEVPGKSGLMASTVSETVQLKPKCERWDS
jgi:hypothetical protein